MESQYRNIYIMGTRLDMVFPGLDPQGCDALFKTLKGELMRLEERLSIYRFESELSQINRTAHAGWIGLDDELAAIFQEIDTYHGKTEGFFDVALKPISDFQGDPEHAGLPLPDEVRQVAGMKNVRIGPQGITFNKKGVQLDLGGYGKGYAIRKILSLMDEMETGAALISFGESLVFGRGTHPYGDSWKVSLGSESAGTPVQFTLHDEALSTSGNTLNNQKKFGNSGHIVNPVTLRTRNEMGMVSVKCADPVRAEIYSTALYSAGRERSAKILEQAPDLLVKWVIPDA